MCPCLSHTWFVHLHLQLRWPQSRARHHLSCRLWYLQSRCSHSRHLSILDYARRPASSSLRTYPRDHPATFGRPKVHPQILPRSRREHQNHLQGRSDLGLSHQLRHTNVRLWDSYLNTKFQWFIKLVVCQDGTWLLDLLKTMSENKAQIHFTFYRILTPV